MAERRHLPEGLFIAGVVGGLFLAATGGEAMTSGYQRFMNKATDCSKALSEFNPPKYTLVRSNEVCLEIENGVPVSQIIERFNHQAESEYPWAVGRLTMGLVLAGGTIAVGFGPAVAEALVARRARKADQPS